MEQTQNPAQSGLLKVQKDNYLAHLLYSCLPKKVKDPEHARTLTELSEWEFNNYRLFVAHTSIESKRPNLILKDLSILQAIFGLTFVVKLAELGERSAELAYATGPLYASTNRKRSSRCSVTAGCTSKS